MASDATNDTDSHTLDAPIACARASMLSATDRALTLAAGGDRRTSPKANMEEHVGKWNRVLAEHAAQTRPPEGSLAMEFEASLRHLSQPAALDERPPRMKFE